MPSWDLRRSSLRPQWDIQVLDPTLWQHNEQPFIVEQWAAINAKLGFEALELTSAIRHQVLDPTLWQHNEQPFIFQQDGTHSHTSASTLAYFAEHADDCELLPPSKWPAKSPDLNPCDYSIWNELNASLHKRMQFENVEEMKAHLLRVCDQLPQQHIDNCINSFRKRCRHVIEVDGYNIDHMS